MSFVNQHQIVVAKVRHCNALHALFLGEFIQVNDLYGCEQIRTGFAGKQPRSQTAFPHFALVLQRHLLIRRHQHNIVQPLSRTFQIMTVLQNMGVHEERLSRTRRALESESVQVFYCIVWHDRSRTMAGFLMVQVGEQGLGIVKIAMQIMFCEQQGEILVGFPGPPVFLCHTQLVAVRRDVGVVFGKLNGRNTGASGMWV